MAKNLYPTKGNLIQAKNTLALSKKGYELLDKKRNILVKEMMTLIDEADAIQSRIDETFSSAYQALQQANIEIGIQTVEQISYAVKVEDDVKIKTRSIMGVEIPIATIPDKPLEPQFGLSRTTISLDEAYKRFDEVKKLTVHMAEIENAVYRLAINIKRTQKRANALKNIMIPRYEKLTKHIENVLEEREREEFTRLKMIKNIS